MSIEKELGTTFAVDLVRVFKLLHVLKTVIPRAHDAVEQTAYPVLFALHQEPARITVLAERTHSDPSVVSRQVSHLEQHGLLAKSPDPQDRRASLVSLTGKGHEVVQRILVARGEWFTRILSDWTPEDVERFDSLLRQFAHDLEREISSHDPAALAHQAVTNPHDVVTQPHDNASTAEENQ